MPVRWRRAQASSARVVHFSGLSLGDLFALAGATPLLTGMRWRPATDVYETADEISLAVEIPGVPEEDIDIELYPDAVVIDGYRSPQLAGGDAIYHSLEIRHGAFRVEVPLPSGIDVDQLSATLEDGILRIKLPKSAPLRVPITGDAALSEPDD